MLAVGRVAEAVDGDERAVPLVHPTNPRNEVHDDEDFQSSDAAKGIFLIALVNCMIQADGLSAD
jgi:hypothetical protein